jgi:Family of unknown function (DUF6328)
MHALKLELQHRELLPILMTALKDKIQNALDESRMLVLGAEILIGFEFAATFQDGFRGLSVRSQALNAIALSLMLVTLVLLISPAAYHQIVDKGSDSVPLHQFTTHVMEAALLPFAIALGANLYIPAEKINGAHTGAIFGLAMTFLACIFWYGPVFLRNEMFLRNRQPSGPKRRDPGDTPEEPQATPSPIPPQSSSASGGTPTPVHDKIRQVLTEARVIIPGNQALLGFQFAVILQHGFTELPAWVQWVHLVSLSLLAVSTVLLLTPAAYHRIVEHGEETEGFYRVANILVLSSMPPLAVGICGDFFVVIFKMSGEVSDALLASGLMLCIFTGLWFGYTYFRRLHPPVHVHRPGEPNA